jgi:putative phosphoribosyl transferase
LAGSICFIIHTISNIYYFVYCVTITRVKKQPIIFHDRIDAGNSLVKKLLWLKRNKANEPRKQNIVVVAIPRGGLIIGDVIASELGAKLDIVVSRKIGAPDNQEFAIGAVMPDGCYFLNEERIGPLNISQTYIEEEARAQLKEIYRRLLRYRGSLDYDKEFERKIVVLVDDGIATGATLMASAKWIKNTHDCKKLIIAAPVAPRDILDDLNGLADEVVVSYTPEPFIAIGRFWAS